MVGDSYAKDMVGAAHVGIDGFLLDPQGAVQIDDPRVRRFASFGELGELLHG
jgi:FMN phosphatase YigB (HAD superfamily)